VDRAVGRARELVVPWRVPTAETPRLVHVTAPWVTALGLRKTLATDVTIANRQNTIGRDRAVLSCS